MQVPTVISRLLHEVAKINCAAGMQGDAGLAAAAGGEASGTAGSSQGADAAAAAAAEPAPEAGRLLECLRGSEALVRRHRERQVALVDTLAADHQEVAAVLESNAGALGSSLAGLAKFDETHNIHEKEVRRSVVPPPAASPPPQPPRAKPILSKPFQCKALMKLRAMVRPGGAGTALPRRGDRRADR